MGLYVNSVSDLPLSESRAYYLYVLDYYCWDEPVYNALLANIERIAAFCAMNDAVLINGLPSSHFHSEVLSWVKINAEEPSTVLPALLITTIHPKYFIQADNRPPQKEIDEALILIRIRDVCKSPGEVVTLLEKIQSDIKQKRKLSGFAIAREMRKGTKGALVDALILEPSVAGVGVDVKKILGWIKGKLRADV